MITSAVAAALSVAVLLLSPAHASSGRTSSYGLRDLGTLGGMITAAADVNAFGQVAGVSMTSEGFLHAFLWSKGKMRDIGTLGGQSSYATALDDFGAVVGYSNLPAGVEHAFLWRSGSGMQDLGTLGGTKSFAADVNDLGVVVGRSLDSTQTPHGFVWTQRGGMKELAGDPFSTAGAVGPDAAGSIAGSAGLPLAPGQWGGPPAPFHSFELPEPFVQGQAYALDARGDAVGTMSAEGGLTHAFFHRAGAATDLGRLGGLGNSEAYSISNSLRIVGVAYDDPFERTVGWLARGSQAPLEPLGDLAGDPGWALSAPRAINDLGQIAGTGFHAGQTRGFLLTPARKDQLASLRSLALGGRAFRRRVVQALSHLGARNAAACPRLRRLASAAARERSLSSPVRRIVATDIRAFALGLSCRPS